MNYVGALNIIMLQINIIIFISYLFGVNRNVFHLISAKKKMYKVSIKHEHYEHRVPYFSLLQLCGMRILYELLFQ